jgi:glycosyltransferase involved in cell wall biosynthesis
MPKVSVIIPNYNHAPFLSTRIKSVLDQTFADIEVIILDDCSADNSKDIIDSFVNSGVPVSFIANVVNSGSPFIQWNKGVYLAKGEYVWIAESDDVADASLLEELVQKLDQNPKVALSYCQSYRLDAAGSMTGTWKDWTDDLDLNHFNTDFRMAGIDYVEQFLICKNTIPNASAVLFRRSVFEDVGGANGEFRTCGDWLLWLKVLLKYDVAFVAKPLNYFRFHPNSVISLAQKSSKSEFYSERFDRKMREAFKEYIVKNAIPVPASILGINNSYIYSEIGSEGIFEISKGQILKGWVKVVFATLKLNFEMSFLKRAIKATYTRL